MTNKPTKHNKQRSKKKQVLIPIIFRFSSEDVERLDKLAKQLGHTRSSLSRFVMSNFISENS